MNETIVAVASGCENVAISIIRMSGKKSIEILNKIVKTKNVYNTRQFYKGTAKLKGINDDVMAVFFKAPFSYTGEDMCEIHCHGNINIVNKLISECIDNGARLAQAGEFTMRAFLNGKLDLTQAEAVNDIIKAESDAEIRSAYSNLQGELFHIIEKIQIELIKEIAKAEVAIDFPDEDLEEQKKVELKKFLNIFIKRISSLAETYHEGRFIKEGIKVVIIGKPNVGKSMLLNALLKKDRAIVTSEEGTTRDTLEEIFFINGQKFLIIDTAGLRETLNIIEKLGIDRTRHALNSADIVLAVNEVNKAFDIELPANKHIIKVVNKADLLSQAELECLKTTKNEVYISAKTGYNLDELKNQIYKKIDTKRHSYNGLVISNARYYDALIETLKALTNAETFIDSHSLDCTLSDLNNAYRILGRITGIVSNEEILDEIFSSFCVGK